MLNQNQNTTTKRTEAERIAEAAAYEAMRAEAAERQTHGKAAATTAINRKHSASGNKKITAMQNSTKADTATEATADNLSKAGELIAKATELRAEAKAARAYANQSGRTPEEVRTNRAEAERKEAKAENMEKAAKAIETALFPKAAEKAPTFSDFQPIKHDAIMGRMEAERTHYVITPEDMTRAAERHEKQVKKHRPGTPWAALNAATRAAAMVELIPGLLFDMAYNDYIFRAATNAANNGITANLHHDSHTKTTEQKTLATPEIIEAWRATHGNNSGKGYKVYVGRDEADFYTMEYREYKTEPTAWYLVYHHKTVSPTVSLDAYAENSHRAEAEAAEKGLEALKAARATADDITPEIVTNGGIPSIETQEARERIEAIIEAMNPTGREAKFLRYFLSDKAAHAAQKAVNEAEAVKVKARRAEEAAKAAKLTALVQKTDKARAEAKAAQRAAKEARAEADKIQALTEEGETLKGTDLIRYRAMKKAAAAHVGILTTTAETTFINRLKARVIKAVGIEQGCPTPEEAAEAEAKHWEQMQKNRTRGHAEAEAVTVLFVGIDSPEAIAKAAPGAIKAAQRAAKRAEERGKAAKAEELRTKAERIKAATKATEARAAAPVIAWNESGIVPQTMTPAEVEAMTARERAAEAARLNQYGGNIAFIEYRRRMRYEAARTPWKALDATAAAIVFLDHMSPEEQAAFVEARRAERAADTARLKAEATEATKNHEEAWNSRKGYQITPKAWNSMEAAQRLAMLDRIHADGMKLEFITA